MIASLTQACEVAFAGPFLSLGSLRVGLCKCLAPERVFISFVDWDGHLCPHRNLVESASPFLFLVSSFLALSVPLFWTVFS